MRKKRNRTSITEVLIHNILLPLTFVVTVLLIILPFMGYDLGAIATNVTKKPIAFFERTFAAEPSEDESDNRANLEEKLKEKEKEIYRLSKTIKEQKSEIEEYKKELENLKESIEEDLKTSEEREKKQQTLATMYEGMTPSKSAAIIQKLTLHEAALLLDKMGGTEQAAILSKMNSAVAADITIALRDLEKAEEPEIAAMQERLSMLMSAIRRKDSSITIENLAKEIEGMEAKEAAGILESMGSAKEEKEVGTQILAELDESKRIIILSEMDEDISSKYVAALAN